MNIGEAGHIIFDGMVAQGFLRSHAHISRESDGVTLRNEAAYRGLFGLRCPGGYIIDALYSPEMEGLPFDMVVNKWGEVRSQLELDDDTVTFILKVQKAHDHLGSAAERNDRIVDVYRGYGGWNLLSIDMGFRQLDLNGNKLSLNTHVVSPFVGRWNHMHFCPLDQDVLIDISYKYPGDKATTFAYHIGRRHSSDPDNIETEEGKFTISNVNGWMPVRESVKPYA